MAARHLHFFGYNPTMYYPKQGKSELYQVRVLILHIINPCSQLDKRRGRELIAVCRGLQLNCVIFRFPSQTTSLHRSRKTTTLLMPFSVRAGKFSFDGRTKSRDDQGRKPTTSLGLTFILGFSFSGEVRQPFPPVISALATSPIPVLAVDAPSSWGIESGPPSSKELEKPTGHNYYPHALISLTAPKPVVQWFINKPGDATKKRHFLGGRFLGRDVAQKYDLDVPEYPGTEQVVEVDVPLSDGKL